MVRVTGSLCLLIALAGCATSGSTAGSSEVAPATAPVRAHIPLHAERTASKSAPVEIRGYSVADSVRYPRPELGTLYRYRGGGPLDPDFFLYPRGEDQSVANDAESFRQVLEINRRRGLYASYEIQIDRPWSPAPDTPGHEIIATLHIDEIIHTSYYYIFELPEQFAKVRITLPQGTAEMEAVRAFVVALLEKLGQ